MEEPTPRQISSYILLISQQEHGTDTLTGEDVLADDNTAIAQQKDADSNKSQSNAIEEDQEGVFSGNNDKAIEDSLDMDSSTESNHMGGDQEEFLDKGQLDAISSKNGAKSQAAEDMDVTVSDDQEPAIQESMMKDKEAEYSSGAEAGVVMESELPRKLLF